MPQSFARLQIERDQALPKQTVAGAMATVVIAGRQLDWQINDAELFVNRNLSPDARVTGVRPRVALPCFVSDLAGPRDGVENPEALARADVIASDETFLVFWALGCPARQVCGADDHRVPDHYGRCVEAYLARDEIHLLIVFQLQIDNAVVPEPGYRHAGLGVHSDHLIARCDINDPLLPAVGPVRQTAARELPWRRFAAFAFVDTVHPPQLPGGGIEREDRAPCAAPRVEHAVYHERRRLVVEFGARAQVVGLEPPGHLQFAEVAGIDLVERRVTSASEISSVSPPLAVFGPQLSLDRHRRPEKQAGQWGQPRDQTTERLPHVSFFSCPSGSVVVKRENYNAIRRPEWPRAYIGPFLWPDLEAWLLAPMSPANAGHYYARQGSAVN